MAMMHLLSSSPDSIIAESSFRRQQIAIPSKNRVVQPSPLNMGYKGYCATFLAYLCKGYVDDIGVGCRAKILIYLAGNKLVTL